MPKGIDLFQLPTSEKQALSSRYLVGVRLHLLLRVSETLRLELILSDVHMHEF